MIKTPRPHQESAIQSLFDYDYSGNPLIVVPVGGGKTLIAAEFIKRACMTYPGTRIMVLAHVTELIVQTAETLLGQWPDARISFYAAKLGQKRLDGDVIFASIQSVFRHAFELTRPIDLVIIDEAHLVSPKQNTAYQKLLSDLRVINPNLKVIGLTGTPFRPTEGTLIEGEGRIFTEILYQVPMLYLIEKGYLCPPVTPRMNTQMSTDGVAIRNGDYVESQLQAAVDKDDITKACVTEIIQHGQKRKKWMVFTAGVEHCEHVRDEIRSRGISCEMVTGKTPTHERNAILKRFKQGDLRCLVNVACLTTGYDNPETDLLAIMRPMRSPVLYVQVCGRVIRTFPGKKDGLILDFGGVVESLGPLDTIDVKKATKGDGEAPVKVCPRCEAVCFAGVRKCQDCGFDFPFEDPFEKLVRNAVSAPVISSQIEPEWHEVVSVTKNRHEKAGKPPTMRVTYYTLSGRFSEWLGFEHGGRFGQKAKDWHCYRYPSLPPQSVDEALKLDYPWPKRILVLDVPGKFPEIVRYDFSEASSKDVVQELDEYEIPF